MSGCSAAAAATIPNGVKRSAAAGRTRRLVANRPTAGERWLENWFRFKLLDVVMGGVLAKDIKECVG